MTARTTFVLFVQYKVSQDSLIAVDDQIYDRICEILRQGLAGSNLPLIEIEVSQMSLYDPSCSFRDEIVFKEGGQQ